MHDDTWISPPVCESGWGMMQLAATARWIKAQHRKTQSTFDRYTSGYGVASFPARIRPEQVEAGYNLTPFLQGGAIHILASCMVIWPEFPSHHTMWHKHLPHCQRCLDWTCQRSYWALRLCRMPRAAWRSLLRRYKRNNGCICEMSYAVCGTVGTLFHISAQNKSDAVFILTGMVSLHQTGWNFSIDRNNSGRLTQAFANCRPLEGKHKTRRGNYCFFPGEACQRDSAAFVHEHITWWFMVLSDFWRNSQDFQAVECWMELWLALISWFLRQGKGGKADPSSWIGMLAFVPKTAHPAALVQLLPERAAFGRLKRLGHSARWEILLANTPRCGMSTSF